MTLKSIWFTACCVCQLASERGDAICGDCEELLKNLSGTQNQSEVVFSSQWQAFRYLGIYDDLLAKLINQGKFQANYSVLKQLAGLFCKQLVKVPLLTEGVVIPVPMKLSRRLIRGFNQAEVIARCLARELDLQYSKTLVRHTGIGRVQHHLNRRQRKANMRKAFCCVQPAPKVAYIVDDVFTTGATVKAMCDCLRARGAEYIEVWVVAKA